MIIPFDFRVSVDLIEKIRLVLLHFLSLPIFPSPKFSLSWSQGLWVWQSDLLWPMNGGGTWHLPLLSQMFKCECVLWLETSCISPPQWQQHVLKRGYFQSVSREEKPWDEPIRAPADSQPLSNVSKGHMLAVTCQEVIEFVCCSTKHSN